MHQSYIFETCDVALKSVYSILHEVYVLQKNNLPLLYICYVSHNPMNVVTGVPREAAIHIVTKLSLLSVSIFTFTVLFRIMAPIS